MHEVEDGGSFKTSPRKSARNSGIITLTVHVHLVLVFFISDVISHSAV